MPYKLSNEVRSKETRKYQIRCGHNLVPNLLSRNDSLELTVQNYAKTFMKFSGLVQFCFISLLFGKHYVQGCGETGNYAEM